VGGTLVGAINPLGPALLLFPVHLLGKQHVLSSVIEWQSPSFSSNWARLFLVQVMLAIVLLVRRPSYRAAVPLVVFTAAALLGQRNIAVASIVMVPGMARGFAGVGTLRGDRHEPVGAVAMIGVVVVAVLMAAVTLGQSAFDLRTYPTEAVAWLAQAGLVRRDLPMATTDTTGNYLELLYGPNARAFIDDRVDMYPTAFVNDYLVLSHGEPGWQQVLDRHGVDLVLWDRDSPVSTLLAESSGWRALYLDADSTVFCRRGVELGGSLGRC
jgi:hypothetical protein